MRTRINVSLGIIVLLLFSGVCFSYANDDLQIVFDPQLRSLIQGAITQSQTTIDVEVYKLTDRGVIADLIQAAQRGVSVRIILCPTQRSNQKAVAQFLKTKVKVRWYPIVRENQIMHIKMGLFDGQRLIFGSPNWTNWGLTLHHEGVFNIQEHAIVKQMEEQFQIDWKKSVPAKIHKELKNQ